MNPYSPRTIRISFSSALVRSCSRCSDFFGSGTIQRPVPSLTKLASSISRNSGNSSHEAMPDWSSRINAGWMSANERGRSLSNCLSHCTADNSSRMNSVCAANSLKVIRNRS